LGKSDTRDIAADMIDIDFTLEPAPTHLYLPPPLKQNIGPISQSKADLASFCLETTRQLDIKYESPPMPVNLSASGILGQSRIFDDDMMDGADGGDDNNPKGDDAKERKPKIKSLGDVQDIFGWYEIRKQKK
jgi:hypothetical protein